MEKQRFLIDTSIWIDLYENRSGFNGEPLGDYALKLLSFIKTNHHRIVLTKTLLRELEKHFSMPQINGMMKPFDSLIDIVQITEQQMMESVSISEKRGLPKGDAIHAITARDHGLILISRDKHFRILDDISEHFKPEEIV